MNNTIYNLIAPGSVMINRPLIETCGGLEKAWVLAHLLKAKTGEWVTVSDGFIETGELLASGLIELNNELYPTISVRVLTANLESHLTYWSSEDLRKRFTDPKDYIRFLLAEQEEDPLNPITLSDVERLRVDENSLDSPLTNSEPAAKNSKEKKESKKRNRVSNSKSKEKKERDWQVSSSESTTTNLPQDQIEYQSDPAKEGVHLSETTWTQQCLNYFSEITGIPIPPQYSTDRLTPKGKPKKNPEYGVLWVAPIVKWLKMTSNLEKTLLLIKQTVEKMDFDNSIIYSPNSLHKTLVAMYRKQQRLTNTVKEVW